MFAARGLTKRFGRALALDGLDLELVSGQTTVLLGENGAGKSTLLRLALGVLRPHRGSLIVAGRDPWRDPDSVRRSVGYVPDRPDAPSWMTIVELCRFMAAHQPGWHVSHSEDLIERLDIPRERKLGQMSRGQAMKVMLVLAVGHDPDVLLLDEPFGGLDPVVREEVLRTVIGAMQTDGRTILCATHELDVAARIADRVAIIADGRVRRHGAVAEVLNGDDSAELPRGLHDALVAATEEVVPC